MHNIIFLSTTGYFTELKFNYNVTRLSRVILEIDNDYCGEHAGNKNSECINNN